MWPATILAFLLSASVLGTLGSVLLLASSGALSRRFVRGKAACAMLFPRHGRCLQGMFLQPAAIRAHGALRRISRGARVLFLGAI